LRLMIFCSSLPFVILYSYRGVILWVLLFVSIVPWFLPLIPLAFVYLLPLLVVGRLGGLLALLI
jgi:hypothetical protein